MKNLQESLRMSLNEVQNDKFNEWLSDAYGYEDLYDYFEELLNNYYHGIKITKQNWMKLSTECYEKYVDKKIIDNAKKFRLDPKEVCDTVFWDWMFKFF